MPIKFDSTEKALDTWNELGYPYKMQFKLHEQKLCPDDKERVEMFSLCCAMRGQQKFAQRFNYLPNAPGRLSRCPVNVRFRLNRDTGQYEM